MILGYVKSLCDLLNAIDAAVIFVDVLDDAADPAIGVILLHIPVAAEADVEQDLI